MIPPRRSSTLTLVLLLAPLAWAATPARADSAVDLSFRGRVQVDALAGDARHQDIDTRAALRRAGFGVTARWRNGVSLDAATAIDEDGAALSGLFVAYEPSADVRLRLGKFGGPVGLERRASSGDTLLMERALPNALTSRAAWGAAASVTGDNGNAEIAWFSAWHENDVDTRGSDGRGMAARVAWYSSTADRDPLLLHVGVSGEIREPDAGQYRVRARPEAELVPTRLLDTRLLRDVTERRSVGIELAAIAGTVLLQAELMRTALERDRRDATLNGGYLQLGWVVAGSPRRYRDLSAAIGAPRGLGNHDAVELVARYSTLDLSDTGLDGGEGDVYALAVNWFVSRHVRLAVVASRAAAAPDRSGRDERMRLVQARVQLEF